MDAFALLLAATLNAGTVLAIAALGLLINERAGVVNLGAEGMMLVAAVVGFATAVHTGSDWLAFGAGAVAGALLAACFGLLAIWLNTNQVATGLALSLFGGGFSAFIGQPFGITHRPVSRLVINKTSTFSPRMRQQTAPYWRRASAVNTAASGVEVISFTSMRLCHVSSLNWICVDNIGILS